MVAEQVPVSELEPNSFRFQNKAAPTYILTTSSCLLHIMELSSILNFILSTYGTFKNKIKTDYLDYCKIMCSLLGFAQPKKLCIIYQVKPPH